MEIKSIDPYSLDESVFRLLDKDWMLITAGNKDDFNTMTASWGGFGILWNKSVAFIFVRPNRFTYQFLEKNEYFTLSFLHPGHRKALNYCGAHSGRDVDKIAETGLKIRETRKGNIYFKESRIVMECRKIYFQDLEPSNFIDRKIDLNYPKMDYHRLYIGEVENCWINGNSQ